MNGPHPIAEFFGSLWGGVGSLFSPVVNWWGFMGKAPIYFEWMLYAVFALIALKFLEFFSGRK